MSELLEKLQQQLNDKFGDAIISSEMDRDFPSFVVAKSSLIAIIEYLKTDANTGFKFLTTLCGIHYPDNTGAEFAVMYQLHNLEKNHRIRLKVFTSEKDMNIPTITHLYASANWMERQEYDFFGFKFTGHPNLKRILNMDEMNYFPMRKEYALEDSGRDDKQDKYFGR